MYPTDGPIIPLVCVGKLTLIDINLGHIFDRLSLSVCVYTLLYCADNRRRDFLTWTRREGGNDCAGRCVAFCLESEEKKTPCRLAAEGGRHELVSSSFSCPCVGKHQDIPTDTQRKKSHRAPVSSPLLCLNNHKNLHTVHRNGLKEKVEEENKKKNGPHKDSQTLK